MRFSCLPKVVWSLAVKICRFPVWETFSYISSFSSFLSFPPAPSKICIKFEKCMDKKCLFGPQTVLTRFLCLLSTDVPSNVTFSFFIFYYCPSQPIGNGHEVTFYFRNVSCCQNLVWPRNLLPLGNLK